MVSVSFSLSVRTTDLGAIGKLVFGKVNLSERAFANQLSKPIISDILEVLVGEFATVEVRTALDRHSELLLEKFLVRPGKLPRKATISTNSKPRFPQVKIPWPFVPAPRLLPYLFAYPPRAAKTALSLAHDHQVSRVLQISATISFSTDVSVELEVG